MDMENLFQTKPARHARMLRVAAFILFLSTLAFGQYKKSPGFAKLSCGYGYSYPIFSGTKLDAPWGGFHFRNTWFEAGFFSGEGTYERESLADTTGKGAILALGWNMPLPFFTYGTRYLGVKGFLIQPIVGVHYNVIAFGGGIAHAVNFSPGITFQFPYVLLDARMNIAYAFGGKQETASSKEIKGLIFYPQLTLQLDGLVDLWNPKTVKTGRHSGNLGTSTSYGGWTFSRRSSFEVDWFSSDVRPFWALSPRISMGTGTTIAGIGLSGRAGALMADASVDFGSFLVHSPTSAEMGVSVDDEQFNGSISGSRFMLSVGISPVYLFKSVFMSTTMSKIEGAKLTPMFRTYMGLRFGYGLLGDVAFDRPGAEDELAAIYNNNPQLDEKYDARKITSGGMFAVFATIEWGSISVFFEAASGKSMTLASQQTVGISYLLPLGRLLKLYRSKP